MLVLSRQRDEVIQIGSPFNGEVIVVELVSAKSIRMIVRQGMAPPLLHKLKIDSSYKICEGIEVSLLSVDGEKALIGFIAPKETQIHRKEVYVAIQQANRAALNSKLDEDDGLAGAPVPRPSSPKPPTLDVRLDEPRSDLQNE